MKNLLTKALRNPFFHSISTKFLLTFLIFLIFPLIFSTRLFSTRFRAIIMEKEQNYSSEKMNFINTQFNRTFHDVDQILTSIILNDRVSSILKSPAKAPDYAWFLDYKAMENILQLLASNADYDYGITVIRPDNTIYQTGANYNRTLTMSSDIVDLICAGKGKAVIFNRQLTGIDNTPVLTIGRSVYEKKNLLGIVIVEVPLSYLDNLFEPADSDSQFFILNADNSILYSSFPLENDILPASVIEALKDNSTFCSIGEISYFMQRKEVSQSALTVLSLIPEDAVFQDSRLILKQLFLSFGLIITLTVLGIFFLTRFFVRDIRLLNQEVSKFGENVESTIHLPTSSMNEIGQLNRGVISMSLRIKNLLHQIQENEKNKRILEFRSLQTQINPHMIYNTLNTITYLAELQNVENIREVSSSFATLLKSLSNTAGEFISIRQEIEYLKAYINIKRYSLLGEIQTDYYIQDSVYSQKILKLLLQPIVENAIVHGFKGRLENCVINISILQENNFIHVEIKDNGNGMDESMVSSILSGTASENETFLKVGMRNIMERLYLQYGNQANFHIQSAPGKGTSVRLSFPQEPLQE